MEVSTMDVTWREVAHPRDIRARMERHLGGRSLRIERPRDLDQWHWSVRSPRGHLLALGVAPTQTEAECAAEWEATAVHPASDAWIDELVEQ
jgi:hypothetical protein